MGDLLWAITSAFTSLFTMAMTKAFV